MGAEDLLWAKSRVVRPPKTICKRGISQMSRWHDPQAANLQHSITQGLNLVKRCSEINIPRKALGDWTGASNVDNRLGIEDRMRNLRHLFRVNQLMSVGFPGESKVSPPFRRCL